MQTDKPLKWATVESFASFSVTSCQDFGGAVACFIPSALCLKAVESEEQEAKKPNSLIPDVERRDVMGKREIFVH